MEKETPTTTRRKRGQSSSGEASTTSTSTTSHIGADGKPETPGEAIVRKLMKDRIIELKKNIEGITEKVVEYEEDIGILRKEDASEEQLNEIEKRIENEAECEALETKQRDQWIKEREEKKKELAAKLKATIGAKPLSGAAAAAANLKQQLLQQQQHKPEESEQPTVGQSLDNSVVDTISSSTGVEESEVKAEPSEAPVVKAEDETSSVESKTSTTIVPTKGVKEEDNKKIENAEDSTAKEDGSTVLLATPTHQPRSLRTPRVSGGSGRSSKRVSSSSKKGGDTTDNDSDQDDQLHATAGRPENKDPTPTKKSDKLLPPPTTPTSTPKRESGRRTLSERSNEEEANEDTPLSLSRNSRSSRQTRRQLETAASAETSSSENVTPVVENKRLSRLRNQTIQQSPTVGSTPPAPEADSASTSRGRRGSGATSRSSSPTGSAAGSEASEPADKRSTRSARPSRGSTRVQQQQAKEDSKFATSSIVKDEELGPDSPMTAISSVSSDNEVSLNIPVTPTDTKVNDDMTASELKSWKKQALMLWNDMTMHRFSHMLMNPVNGSTPGYSSCVFRPTDLTSIKRQIEAGSLRNITEFQREIYLMLLNASMFNTSDSEVITYLYCTLSRMQCAGFHRILFVL